MIHTRLIPPFSNISPLWVADMYFKNAPRSKRSDASASRRRSLRLETLEARAMLAVMVENLAFSPATINEGGTTTLSGQVSALPVLGGLKLWLDAGDSSTIVTDANGRVEQWLDKSGLDNDATQTNPAMRPTRELTALNG